MRHSQLVLTRVHRSQLRTDFVLPANATITRARAYVTGGDSRPIWPVWSLMLCRRWSVRASYEWPEDWGPYLGSWAERVR